MPNAKTIGNKIAPAKFLLFLGVLVGGWIAGSILFGFELGLLGGFDVAAVVFLWQCASIYPLSTAALRKAAAGNDANRWMLLLVSFLVSLVIFAAIIAQLANPERPTAIDKGIIAVTLVLVWTFGNMIYTLHYAHLYYSSDDGGKDCAGLDFPKTREPDFWDFTYFAFTIGAALQTADVGISSPHFRRIVTVHCVIAFFFNLGVLALTINVLASR